MKIMFLLLFTALCLPVVAALAGLHENLLLADHSGKRLLILSAHEEIVWQHPAAALFDAWMQDDGTIVYSTRDTVENIRPDLHKGTGGEVCWSYKLGTRFDQACPKKSTITGIEPLENGHFLITETGTHRLVEIDGQGNFIRAVPLPPTHAGLSDSLRLTRVSPDALYYVPYMGEGKVNMINGAGAIVDTIDLNAIAGLEGASAYETFFLPNGELLISCGPANQVVKLDKDRNVVWRLTPEDLPDIRFYWITSLVPRKNGNLIVLNYCKGQARVKAFEITPDKKIVWQLTHPAVKGLTKLQILERWPLADVQYKRHSPCERLNLKSIKTNETDMKKGALPFLLYT